MLGKWRDVEILKIAEVRWKDTGQIRLSSGETIIYSGHVEDQVIHSESVAIMISEKTQTTLTG